MRTIERILERGGLTRRPGRRRRAPKGIAYPAPLATSAGDLHEADLVGPRYLDGGLRFYALNAVDLAPRRVGIEVVRDKSDDEVARGLVALWGRLGVPARLKLDNGGPFVGARGLKSGGAPVPSPPGDARVHPPG